MKLPIDQWAVASGVSIADSSRWDQWDHPPTHSNRLRAVEQNHRGDVQHTYSQVNCQHRHQTDRRQGDTSCANQEQCTQRRNASSKDIVSASERTSTAIYIARRTQIIGIKLNVASTNAASRASRIPTSPIKEATDIEISPSIEA